MPILMFQKQDWSSGDEVNLEKVPFLDSLSLSGHHILKADHQRIAEKLHENKHPVHMIVIFGKLILNEKLEDARLPRKWMFGIHHPA